MLKVTIVSPLEKYDADQISELYLDTVTGQRGILPSHMALVAQLKNGSLVRLVTADFEICVRIGADSFLKFAHDEAIILTQRFVHEEY